MKSVKLALAATLIGIFGVVQPVNAQSSDQSGGAKPNPNLSDPQSSYSHHDCDWHSSSQRCGPRGMHQGWMRMRGWGGRTRNTGGAHFRLTRGDTTIDIRCPANQAVERCVRAAGDLLDKIKQDETAGANMGGAPNANLGQRPAPPSPPTANPNQP